MLILTENKRGNGFPKINFEEFILGRHKQHNPFERARASRERKREKGKEREREKRERLVLMIRVLKLNADISTHKNIDDKIEVGLTRKSLDQI